MNALPPVPAVWGDGWQDEWRRRVDETPPWALDWLRQQVDGPMWRRGSIRLGPTAPGYERITCPTMIVAGWADGYRNNTFRTVSAPRACRGACSPDRGATPTRRRRGPGPNIDADRRDDRLLRRAPARRTAVGGRARPRCSSAARSGPSPISPCTPACGATRHGVAAARLRTHRHRRLTPATRRRRARRRRRRRHGGVELVRRRPAVGAADRPARRRRPLADLRLADRRDRPSSPATPRSRLRVRASAPVAHLAVQAVRRLPRRHVGADHPGHAQPDPPRVLAGRRRRRARTAAGAASCRASGWTSTVELEATTWTLRARPPAAAVDRRDRLAELLAAAGPVRLGVDWAQRRADAAGVGRGSASTHAFTPGAGRRPVDDDASCGASSTTCSGARPAPSRRYGGRYDGAHGAVVDDDYEGTVGVSTVDPGRAFAVGHTTLPRSPGRRRRAAARSRSRSAPTPRPTTSRSS